MQPRKKVVSIRGEFRRDVVTQQDFELIEIAKRLADDFELASLQLDRDDPVGEMAFNMARDVLHGVVELEVATARRIEEGAAIEPGPRIWDLERRSVARAS